MNIQFIQKKEDISSSVNRLVTAKLPIEAQSLEVETELIENRETPGIYCLPFEVLHLLLFLGKAKPTDKIPLVVTSEK